MNDSDAVDEAEAGQLISFARTLFKWDGWKGHDNWIVLDHVVAVTWENETLGLRLTSGMDITTKDKKTIERFWAEWEII